MQIQSGSRLGPYEIVSPIGAGGMGEVWKARDTRLERFVAVKILPAEFASDATLRLRFEREAKTISQLEHAHICRLYDVGEDHAGASNSAVSYLVMELLEGESLADRLARGPLPMSDVLRYGAEIADALDTAHAAGVVHRDVKPGNIVLTRAGAKLLDFGLARRAGLVVPTEGATVQKPLTQEGTILGTFQYMAPEQLEGEEADARSDIFALGAVLYEMATGRRAFEGKTKTSLIAAILDREPTPISQLQPLTPPHFERVVSTCLNKDPRERWQSAHDLRRELQWIREGVISGSAPVPAAGRTAHRRSAGLWIAAMALLAIATAIGGFFVSRSTAPHPQRLVSAIAPPPGAKFVVTGDTAGPVVLSPDGQMAAFVAATNDVASLWIQSLRNGNRVRLPGTEHAMFPFWSLDSRTLGFFADGKLLTIDVDGSVPRQLANAPDARGGMFTPDGAIIFAPRTQTGLARVSLAGGPVTQLTVPTPPHSTHRWPALLPDGKHFIFLAAAHGNPGGPDTAIMIATLDGRNIRKLTASPGNGIPYRDWVLFLRGERLVAQRLDKDALVGAPVQVWDRVLYDAGTWRAVFSVSGTGLLATYPTAGMSTQRLVEIDRTGRAVEIAPPGIYRDLAISPDGGRIAVTVGDPNSVLYIEDLRRHVRTRFSFADAVGYPTWTSDGRFVVFNRVAPDTGFELLVKPADGSAPERVITRRPFPMQPTDIDAKNGRVLFNALTSDQGDIMSIPLAGGEPSVVVGGPGQQTAAVVSPDGRWLAYVDVTATGRAAFVTTYPSPGPKWQLSDETAYWSWWSSGGKELHYLTGDGEVKSIPVTFEGNAIQFGAPQLRVRVKLNTNRRGISMTPDGERIFAAIVPTADPGPATLISNFDAVLPR